MTDEEVREVVEVARRNSEENLFSDPTYAELMAAYAELGDLLVSGRTDGDYMVDVREATTRARRLSDFNESECQQRLAIFWARLGREAA